MDLSKLTSEEVVQTYSDAIKELKRRKILRTNNVVGDLGEYLVLQLFAERKDLPALQVTPLGTQNVSAISRLGDRYSIKSTTGKTTSVFYGLQPKGSDVPDTQKFEYVLICKLSEEYQLEAIYQLNWNQFLSHRRWHSRMKAWNLSITKALIEDAELIYSRAGEFG